MNPFQLRTIFVLLALGWGTTPAWSDQDHPMASATQSHAGVSKDPSTKTGMNGRVADERPPIVVEEEDIPAFLRTDSCDTGDS